MLVRYSLISKVGITERRGIKPQLLDALRLNISEWNDMKFSTRFRYVCFSRFTGLLESKLNLVTPGRGEKLCDHWQ
jgi:hypothetical protein